MARMRRRGRLTAGTQSQNRVFASKGTPMSPCHPPPHPPCPYAQRAPSAKSLISLEGAQGAQGIFGICPLKVQETLIYREDDF